MLDNKNEKELEKIFKSWIFSGYNPSSDFEEIINSQVYQFNDIRMIPFISINVVIECSGVIGSYERH